MNIARITAIIVGLCAVMWAAASLLTSLTHFGVGVAVAAASLIVVELLNIVEDRHDGRITETRRKVWERRDG